MRCILLLVFVFATSFASPITKNDEFVVGQILDEEKVTLLSKKPALKMRLTKKGMTYLNGKACDTFNEFVENFDMTGKKFEMVDDKSDETLTTTENVFIKITNTTTTNYEPLTFSYTTDGQAITWHGVGGQMTFEGCWEMTTVVDDSNSTAIETGNLTVTTTGMEMITTMTMGMKTGKPSLIMETCKFTMATVQTSFGNSCTKKMCPKDETMMKFWKNTMATNMCSMMTLAVARINRAMQSFDTVMPVGHSPFQMDYTMLAQPKCTEIACETVHMAEIMFNASGIMMTGTMLAVPMPSALQYEDDKAMMIMQMSDYVMNSMSSVMFTMGMMNTTISNDTTTNPKIAAMLRTDCPSTELCMGTATNEMEAKFPNCTVTLHVQAVKPIVFETFAKSGMKMYTQSVITVYHSDEELMRMDVTGRGVVTPELVNATVFMNVTMTDMKVTIMKSVFENVDFVQIEKLAEIGLLTDKMFVDQIFGQHLAGGIPLPGMDGVIMEPCGIFMEDRAIAMCFNMIV